jgi:hypothetical protein
LPESGVSLKSVWCDSFDRITCDCHAGLLVDLCAEIVALISKLLLCGLWGSARVVTGDC